MTLMEKMKVLWGKAFVGGEWKVGYRLRNEPNGQYCLVDTPAGTWAADPFLYEANGEHYLFVELYEEKKNKACIAYYRFIDGVPVYQDKSIDQPYHMSYPCVFEHNGEHYMIPETSANQSVDLYRATEFPKKWEKVKTLVSGARYVDTTVFQRAESYCAVSYQKKQSGWNLDVFELDMQKMNMIKMGTKCFAANIGRPAGMFFYENDLLRPAQDCCCKYGESLILYAVDKVNNEEYEEHQVTKMSAKDIPMSTQPDRIHTYNRDSKYECVDVYFEKFDIAHGVKILWRAYLREYVTTAVSRLQPNRRS